MKRFIRSTRFGLRWVKTNVLCCVSGSLFSVKVDGWSDNVIALVSTFFFLLPQEWSDSLGMKKQYIASLLEV